MCGIAGIWGQGDIVTMTRILQHRGPDEEGFFRTEPVQLGSRRLKVIDLVTGTQPIASEDGKIVIVYNGEIFNYRELRTELQQEFPFKTQTDTEVILHAYRRWGTDCVRRFNGQFAFAIYDGKQLFCARDRMGEKPFYYAHTAKGFFLASEIKAILTQIDSAPRIDESFWVFDCAIAPQTLFTNINELPPGHCLTFNGHTLKIDRYWSLPEPVEQYRQENDLVEELRELLKDAVRLRKIADVPVGLFLSGGLDSAVMAGAMRPQEVFSCRFPLGDAFDEFRYAQVMAEYIGARHHAITPTYEDFRELMPKIVWHLDQPIATASSISEFLLARKASEYVTVVLGGQGADEIFGGYIRYVLMSIENDLARRPELATYYPLARFFWRDDMFGDPAVRYYHLIHRAQVEDPTPHVQRVRSHFRSDRPVIDNIGIADIHLSLPSLITMNDRASSAYGLENRCPFLDHRLVEFAFRLPPTAKINELTTKSILRRAARGLVPDEIIDRRDKKGLVVPFMQWLTGPLREWANELERSLRARGLTIPPTADRGEFDRGLYSRVCLELWFRNFFPDWHG
ncbi:MAG TPA: asparagine synthase (glutamine-hydrolyzing) [bacterium]|nr:asparagine synthase (glutamine-hydrolyzing) [bacterium]